MSPTSWFSGAEMIALGWTLLHFCWQGMIVAFAFALADRLTRRRQAATRYFVALSAFALMPLIVMFTFANEMRNAPENPNVLISHSFTNASALKAGLKAAIPTFIVPVSEERKARMTAKTEQVLPWVDGTWMLGVVLLAIRSFGGWIHLQNVRKRARWSVPHAVQLGFHRMCNKLLLAGEVTLRVSSEAISPMAMGVWRKTVILPVSIMMKVPLEELEAIFAHELAHIKRWDYVTNLIQTAVESALFFHPVVWWVSRIVRERREVCCDEIAVRSCADAVLYARALLRLEEQRSAQTHLAVALAGTKGSLLRRVSQVLGEGMAMESKMTSGVRVVAGGAVMIAMLMGPKVKEAIAIPIQNHLTTTIRQSLPQSHPTLAKVSIAPGTKYIAQARESGAKQDEISAPEAPTIVDISPSSKVAVRIAVAPVALPVITNMQVQVAKMSVNVSAQMKAATILADMQAAVNAPMANGKASGTAYLDGMKDAGYPLSLNNDLDSLVALRSLGVTPEFAKSMNSLGLGKASVQDLITLKALGVTPEYVSELKQSGIGPKDFREVVTEKSLGISPAYVAAMKSSGFGDISIHQLIELKAQGMTPEYASWLKKQFPNATMDELQRAAIFQVNEKFVSQAKAHGFDDKDLDKLLRLSMSGLIEE
jgi:beta-lactamase regulating signal transducer with metallopeptidase domain